MGTPLYIIFEYVMSFSLFGGNLLERNQRTHYNKTSGN